MFQDTYIQSITIHASNQKWNMHNCLNPSLNHHITIYCINQYKNKPSGIICMSTTYPNIRYIVHWSLQISVTPKSFRNLILSPHLLVYSLNSKERNLLTITPNPPEFSPETFHNAFFLARHQNILASNVSPGGTQELPGGSYQVLWSVPFSSTHSIRNHPQFSLH